MYGGLRVADQLGVDRRCCGAAILLAGWPGTSSCALAIPGGFHGTGLTFGLGYLVVIVVHSGFFIGGLAQSSRPWWGSPPYNLSNATLVLVGGALGGGTRQAALWTVALCCVVHRRRWAYPTSRGFEIRSGHFVERHGLIVIVAIGESVVAVGIGAAGLAVDCHAHARRRPRAGLLERRPLVVLLRRRRRRAGRARADRRPGRPPQPWDRVLEGFGIRALLSSCSGSLLGRCRSRGRPSPTPTTPLATAEALVLGGGVALFLAADVGFRRVLGLGRSLHRAVAALLALATVPLGSEVAAVAQLAALVVVLAVALAGEASARPCRVSTY